VRRELEEARREALRQSALVRATQRAMGLPETGQAPQEASPSGSAREGKIKPLVAKRNTEHGSGLDKYRYVVEACFDWLFNWRRLRVRYEKRDDIHDAFLILGYCMICWNRVLQLC
jgi:hypothetical protein